MPNVSIGRQIFPTSCHYYRFHRRHPVVIVVVSLWIFGMFAYFFRWHYLCLLRIGFIFRFCFTEFSFEIFAAGKEKRFQLYKNGLVLILTYTHRERLKLRQIDRERYGVNVCMFVCERVILYLIIMNGISNTKATKKDTNITT